MLFKVGKILVVIVVYCQFCFINCSDGTPPQNKQTIEQVDNHQNEDQVIDGETDSIQLALSKKEERLRTQRPTKKPDLFDKLKTYAID